MSFYSTPLFYTHTHAYYTHPIIQLFVHYFIIILSYDLKYTQYTISDIKMQVNRTYTNRLHQLQNNFISYYSFILFQNVLFIYLTRWLTNHESNHKLTYIAYLPPSLPYTTYFACAQLTSLFVLNVLNVSNVSSSFRLRLLLSSSFSFSPSPRSTSASYQS